MTTGHIVCASLVHSSPPPHTIHHPRRRGLPGDNAYSPPIRFRGNEGGPAEAGPRLPFSSYRTVTLRLRVLRTVWTLPPLVLYFATIDTL
jgi:hypothetical protein